MQTVDGPKLWLFKRRKFYQYDGSIDDLEALHKFAIENYDQAKVQGGIPQEASAFQALWKKMLETIESVGQDLNQFVIKDEKTGQVNYAGLAVFFGIPLIIVLGLCTVMLNSNQSEVVGSKVSEQKDKRKRQ